MDTHSESATHIGDLCTRVYARQESEAVNYQAVSLGCLFGSGLRVAHGGAVELREYLLQMVFAYHMRGDDDAPVLVIVEIADEDILVWRPAASGNEHLIALGEGIHDRHLLLACALLYLQHAVEARVAGNLHIRYAECGEQFTALLVLHEEPGDAVQHAAIAVAIPAEEHLLRAEDAAHAVYGDVVFLHVCHIVPPELILDEERHLRVYYLEEASDVERSVERQVADDVGPLVVLPHFVSRRGEECEESLVFGMALAQTLHYGASLLKLSERCCMEPQVFRIRVCLLPQYVESFSFPSPHLAYLAVPTAGYRHTKKVYIYNDVVHACFFVAFSSLFQFLSLPLWLSLGEGRAGI